MKNSKKDEEPGAPFYMMQYASLMTILLAFFITLLAMGQDGKSDYSEDLGLVQESFFRRGGVGVLPFLKSLMKYRPEVPIEEDTEGDLLGYLKGTFEFQRFDANQIKKTELRSEGQVVRVFTPITFPTDSTKITGETQKFLDKIGSLFYNLKNYEFTVSCYQTGRNPEKEQSLATKRAMAVMFYLVEECQIPEKKLSNAGYVDTKYLGSVSKDEKKQGLIFFIQKMSSNTEFN
jgi:flagellar motor protein MotB